MSDTLERFRDWLSKFEKVSLAEGSNYTNALAFARKIQRVLDDGDTSLGVMPCILCGSIEAFRHTLERGFYRRSEDRSEVCASLTMAACFSHDLQKRHDCPCGEELWFMANVEEAFWWFDAAGALIDCCSGCNIRLPINSKDCAARTMEVFTKAGYVRKARS